jgi:hypothetical protein
MINQSALTEKEKLFTWLYYPFDYYTNNNENITKNTIMKMLSISKKFNIPDNIIFRKIIEYLIIKKNNVDEIINNLVDIKLLNNLDMEFVKKVINEIENLKFNNVNSTSVNIILDMANKYDYNCNTHINYPLPDPEHGRPYLEWSECYYENCHLKFVSPTDLRNHLINLKKYKHGFHMYHEYAVSASSLTPNKVISKQMTYCPSIVCDKSNKKFTPEELCDHFKILGIKPFWKKGDIITNNNNNKNIQPEKKIYISDECLICLSEENKPAVIFYPCFHCVTCIYCYKDIHKCLMCRADIQFIFPY